ncbi:hypothetical protein BCAR13_440041 [Paraburkholderia caribensis]|nr:hypothetical protein BCAR13_440041 [Paraburkholderia caribensis]
MVRRKRDNRRKHDEQAKGELMRNNFKPGVSTARMVMDHGTHPISS